MSRSLANALPPLVKLLAEDRRYKLDAYQFIGAGLEYAQDVLRLGQTETPAFDEENAEVPPQRHVSGQDLCWALRSLAHEQFGFLARLVLGSWGIRSTSDFGEIVYNLIKIGKMSKSEGDRREDFDSVFEFEQAFVKEFVITKGKTTCPH